MRVSRSTVLFPLVSYKLELFESVQELLGVLARCTVVRSPASLKRLARERTMYTNLWGMENANRMTWELSLCILRSNKLPISLIDTDLWRFSFSTSGRRS
jgi:hypothetical protein